MKKRAKPKIRALKRFESLYYTCLACGSEKIPAFHFERDFIFDWHKQFMREKEPKTLVYQEVALER
jgi:hypothetical protein